jgi:CheY-like chemotaxis protein
MILIDEHAEKELVALLEAFKLAPDHSTRLLHFRFDSKAETAGLRDVLIASVERNLPDCALKIFFCDAGDMVVLGAPILSKNGNSVILDVVDHVGKAADQRWVTFDDLVRQIHPLFLRIEPMIEHQRKLEEAARKFEEHQQLARKRQAILRNNTPTNPSDIQQRRNKRQAPELMMIEDDTFSRRLVENVLQKKYALTSLADASNALDSYARIAPDLLFLDINLPDVTGHELLERLLAIDPDAYVVMLSGNADQANIVAAMSKGAKGFIAKPFTREKLFQYIDRCATIAEKQQRQIAQ